MNNLNRTTLAVSTSIAASLDNVWNCWTKPEHIINWNNASDDWHTPSAINDLKVRGQFNYRMESKDGKIAFNFEGTYDSVEPMKEIMYTINDGRKVQILFEPNDKQINVIEKFEAENTHPLDMQKNGWQSILNNFKEYVENKGK